MSLDSSTLGNSLTQEQIQAMAEWIASAVENGDSNEIKSRLEHFKFLSSEEFESVKRILAERREAGYSTFWEMVWQLDFERLPVSFEEWVNDPYYTGDLHKTLYPLWKKELSYICHPQSGVVEWYITGAIGVGKTFASLVGQLYKGPYYCSCLKSPQLYFGGEGEGGIAANSQIVFALFNATLDNATQVNFDQISNFVRESSYFSECCPAEVKKGSGRILWPTKNMSLKVGSGELHALGNNLFGYMIDEVNFMEKPKEKNEDEFQAYKIYYHAVRRMKSRFLKFGTVPGLACIASSRLAQSSFLEKLMETNKGNPACHTSDYAVWDTKGRDKYSPQEFRVAVGNLYRSSEVLDEVDTGGSTNTFDWKVLPEKAKPAPEGMKIVHVPVDFYYDFLGNLDGAIRDVAGLATSAASPLIWRVESVRECAEGFPYSHPFLKETHELSMDDPDSDLLKYVDWRRIAKIHKGAWMPLYHPSEPRFIHCDLGLSGDAAAFSMGCAYATYPVTDLDPLSGQVTESFYPKVWVDFMLRIKPVRGEQIDLAKIVAFILNLRHRGFPLQRVTFDGFASEMAIQIVRKSNQIPDRNRKIGVRWDEKVKLEADVLSVDKDDKPYKLLRDMLFQNAIRMYPYEPFMREVVALEHNVEDKKVDHPPKGSKDVSDSVAGMLWGVATSKVYVRSDPVQGMIEEREKNVESELLGNIVSDYPDKNRVTAVVPAPKPEPRERKLDTGGRGGWQKELGFGKHKLQ